MRLVSDEPGTAGEQQGDLMSRLQAAVEARDAENSALRAGLEKVLAGLDAALAEAAAGRERRERLELRWRSWSAGCRWTARIRGRLRRRSGSGRERHGGRGSSRSGSAGRTARGAGSPATRGKALQRDPDPDEKKDAEPPAQCRRCKAGLEGAGPRDRGGRRSSTWGDPEGDRVAAAGPGVPVLRDGDVRGAAGWRACGGGSTDRC